MPKLLNDFKRNIFKSIKNNKIFFMFILSAFFIGVIIGVISLIAYKEIIVFKNLIDNPLYLYIKHDISLFSFFIRKLLLLLLIAVISFLLCLNKISKYLYLLISLYLGYLMIFNMGVIIICFGFFGFIFALINILLIGLLYFLILTLIVLNCNDCLCFNNVLMQCKNRLSVFLLLLVLLVIACVLEMLLVPLFSSTFIINYL